jgi:hypothetical protein
MKFRKADERDVFGIDFSALSSAQALVSFLCSNFLSRFLHQQSKQTMPNSTTSALYDNTQITFSDHSTQRLFSKYCVD